MTLAGRTARVILVMTLLLPGAGVAQTAARSTFEADTSKAFCDSVLSSAVVDSSRVVVRAVLSSVDGAGLQRPMPGLVLQEIFTRVSLPRPLRIPVFEPGPPPMQSLRVIRLEPSVARRPIVSAVYRFTLHRDGTANGLQVFVPSLVPGLDSAIVATIARISGEHAFPYMLGDETLDSAAVQLRLTSGAEIGGTAIDVFTSMFPSLPVVDAVLRDSMPTPVYPEAEREAKVTGQVLLKLVVDIDGEPVVESLEVLQATTRGFAIAALGIVPRMRWTPAHVDRCAVPQEVYVPVRFTLP